MAYKESVEFLVNIGLLDVVLPFVLVFTIVYAVLQRTKLFAENKNAAAMISFVLGFLTVLATNVLHIIQTILPYFVLAFVTLLLLLLIVSLAGGKPTGALLKWIGLPIFVIFALIGFDAAGVIDFQATLENFLVPILITLALIWGVSKLFSSGKTASAETPKKEKPASKSEAPPSEPRLSTRPMKPHTVIEPEGKKGVLWKEN